MEKSYVLFDVDQEEISIGYGACGSGGDKWYTQNVQHHFQLKDVKEPQILGMAPFSASTYKPGDRITVSLVFDEIVDSQNSSLTNNSTITTSWGTMTYAGGADALRESPSAFVRWCDNRMTEMLKTQKYEAFSVGPLLGYLIARENEIKTVRIILTGKQNGFSDDAVRERIREMYV